MASKRSKVLRFVIKHLVSKLLSTEISPEKQRARLEMALVPLWRNFKFSTDAVDVEGVPSEWMVADGANEERVMLYLHGGAYTMGSPGTHADLTSRMSHFCGMKLLVINYRLAPENPYPAAVEDATSAYRWLIKQGYKPNNIVIGGDSAGGGLTMATLINLRDQGDTLPAAGVCLSPWADLCCEGDSHTTLDDVDPFLSSHWLKEMAKLYVQQEDARNPLISPLFGNFKGLPPILIQVGSDEVLLDDSVRLEKRLLEDGVDVSFKIYQDMWHVWQLFAAIVPEAKEGLLEIAGFVDAKISAAPQSVQEKKSEAVI